MWIVKLSLREYDAMQSGWRKWINGHMEIGGFRAWGMNFTGKDILEVGYGFWLLFGRFMLFLYGYKLFDILVQDQYIVITRKYFVKFCPETKVCKGWDDRSFNTKNQLTRLSAFPFVCTLLTWITLLIRR